MTEPHPSPTKRPQRRRRSSSASKKAPKEDPMPIKFISIEIEDEQRDDENVNVLVSLIQKRDWEGLSSRLQTQAGINEASRALPTKDYALHMLCRCGQDHKVSKYRSFKGGTAKAAETGGSGDISSQGGSIYSGSTPSGSSASITTKDLHEISAMKESFPTRAVLEGVMNAFPNAIRIPGLEEATPLHWAVRHRYPTDLLNVLIRTFPQALDVKDAGTRTPRSYTAIVNTPVSRSSLLRPTSCWIQHITDEKVSNIMAQDSEALEKEVMHLLKSVEAGRGEEEALLKRVVNMEEELNSYGDWTLVHGFADKASEVQDELEGSIDVIRGTLEGLVGQTMLKYADEEKERASLASFNLDVERIYNNANENMDEMSSELEKIVRGLKLQLPKKIAL